LLVYFFSPEIAVKTLGDPDFKTKPRDVKITEIGNIIGEVFDFTELSKRTLGREWKKMSGDQQKEFVGLFKKLLQGVYADRLLAYTDQKVVFDKEKYLKKAGPKFKAISYCRTAKGSRFSIG